MCGARQLVPCHSSLHAARLAAEREEKTSVTCLEGFKKNAKHKQVLTLPAV